MKNKLRFLVKNKQSFITFFVLLVMVFNACGNFVSPPTGNPVSPPAETLPAENPGGSNTGDFTLMGVYVDSNGNFTETDSGRTVLVTDDKAEVVFYSDNIESGDDDHVGLTFEGKNIIFLFEKDRNFPSRIVLSDSEESYNGIFTPYDPVTQTYGLTIEQGRDKETLSNIALSKDIFTQYKDDTELTPSQNLRMRNLYIAACIYKSLDEFITSGDILQARGIFSKIWNGVKNFFSQPIVQKTVNTVVAAAQVGFDIVSIIFLGDGGDSLLVDIVDFFDAFVDLLKTPFPVNPVKPVPVPSGGGGGSGGGGSSTVGVTGISLNKPSTSLVVGGTETLTPTITPANATNKTVYWSSTDVSIATVSSSGTVTGVSVGTATITVATVNGNKTADSTVTVNKAAGATVSTPILNTKTYNSITINAVSEPGTGQSVEYAINTSNAAPLAGWQAATTFNSLNTGTTYYIFARSASNNSYNTGVASGSLTIATLQTVSSDKIEYYWVDQHDNLVTTSGGAATITIGSTLVITAQDTGYIVKNWYLNGVKTEETGNIYNFSSATTGKHTVSVVVEKSGKPYNTNITITVQ